MRYISNLLRHSPIFSYILLNRVIVFVSLKKRAPTRTIEQRNKVGARIKIMSEEQLVDPPFDYLTSVNEP